MNTTTDKLPLRPSNAYQWGNCSGSAAAIRRCRDDDRNSDARELGTAVHELIAMCVQHALEPDVLVGQITSNNITIDDEMVGCAEIMLAEVRPLMHLEHIVEHELLMPQILPEHRGYIDFAAYDRANAVVYAFEYKNGRSAVSAYNNFQMIDYSLGLINFWNISTPVQFVFKVVQPRSYSAVGPVRTWSVMSYELEPIYQQLRANAVQAVGPNPLLSVGKHCHTCPAVGICTAARQSSYNVIDYSDEPLSTDDMSDVDLGIEYDMLQQAMKLLKKRYEAIDDELRYRIHLGSVGTGYSVERNPGKWVWQDSDPDTVIDTVRTQFGYDPEVRSVKTVAQVRDALPSSVRKMFESMKPLLATRKKGSEVLVPTSSSRSARVFGGNQWKGEV